MKVINLFAGPGAGKSTTRAGLFNLMKNNQKNCEEVTEYAKDVTWEGTQILLSDQLYVLANQNRRLSRLQDKVEYAISDAPILLTINYVDPQYLPYTFRGMAMELWNTYDNINYFIERDKPYNPVGRNQNEGEAREIDRNILMMLDYHKIPYKKIKGDSTAPYRIFNDLFPEKRINTKSELILSESKAIELARWINNLPSLPSEEIEELRFKMIIDINGINNGLIIEDFDGNKHSTYDDISKW